MPFPPAFDAAWDDTFPPDSQQANQLGADIRNFKRDIRERHALLSGTIANQPTNMDASFGGAGYGTLYFATDTGQVFQWNGAAWGLVNPPFGPSYLYGRLGIISPKAIRAFGTTAGAGNLDLYTVPAGKRALLYEIQSHNGNAGGLNWFSEVKIGANYFRLGATTFSNTGAIGLVGSTNTPYIAEAGEGFSINATGNLFDFQLIILEFDNTVSIKTVKLTSAVGLVVGNNTIYTCPAGKTASGLRGQFFSPNSLASASSSYVNDSGGIRTFTSYAVPSGQVPGIAFQTSIAGNTLANNGLTGLNFGDLFTTGDSAVFNLDATTASQIIWMTISEY